MQAKSKVNNNAKIVNVSFFQRFSFTAKIIIEITSKTKKNCKIPVIIESAFPCIPSLQDFII